jgi:calcium/calmodulin-dependent protein kinase I
MATLRHGNPINIEGWLSKEGKIFRGKSKRYMKLRDCVLSNHHSEAAPATWEQNIANCPVQVDSSQLELSIVFPKKRVSFYAETQEVFDAWSAALMRASASGIEDYYTLGKLLGEGAFAQVRVGNDKKTGEEFAIKIIKKKEYDSRETEYILREVSIMKSIKHDNVVNTFDVFDSKENLYIVLEFMKGGELFDIIAESGHFSEKDASQVMRDVVKGVQYLHMHAIVHRDIKPENVLCKAKSLPLQVKLADFGLANFSEDGTVQESRAGCIVGTPGYVAPEVVKREEYGPAIDLWACGVLLYIMLSGKMPFYGRDDNECLHRIARGEYSFPDREWSSISEAGKSIVKALLQVDPVKRLTADSALQHKWLADPTDLNTDPIGNDLSGIHSSRRKFRRAVNVVNALGVLRGLGAVDTPSPPERAKGLSLPSNSITPP